MTAAIYIITIQHKNLIMIPTVEQLLIEEAKNFSSPLTPEGLQLLVINVATELAKLHVTKALDQAFLNSKMRVSENNTNETLSFIDNYDDGDVTITVSKSSILDAYPLDNIK